jgi:hypothetical protein
MTKQDIALLMEALEAHQDLSYFQDDEKARLDIIRDHLASVYGFVPEPVLEQEE